MTRIKKGMGVSCSNLLSKRSYELTGDLLMEHKYIVDDFLLDYKFRIDKTFYKPRRLKIKDLVKTVNLDE